ncbi:MAG: sulfotransferase [Roseofilum sp. SBFL]|uniref:sulfotransferase n=1 Tax=unclassified Roseofilum TaxID=2620099 RepID=UPI001B02ACAA|nr:MULTISPECIES: sulfotransferase [unclassified Roseofilum]MBP0012190.1 sulfotransferase [Roseofilum sp. SID3]MBP0024811.1 sulfotransferase [Roseofilum sp. SID2]MBP0039018.1 sulfotransferase [Roseofilum sp. SID1]MBP0043637.1 sulfotransferase [Roseofilum sp. SBFL]
MTLPNFLLIGAAKSGTSSLYYYLKQHPQVYMPASRDQKEPDFFTLEGEEVNRIGPNGTHVMTNAITDLQSYQELFAEVTNEKAIGEASTSYIYSEKAAQRIHHYIPDAKLIAILRQPAERAFSHFLFSLSNGREPVPDFAKTLKEEEDRIAKNWSFQWHHKRRGFYYVQLKQYFDTFDAKQIRVYLYDDLIENPTGLMKEVFQFLEVEDNFSPNVSKKHNPTRVPKNQTVNTLLNRPNPVKAVVKTLLPMKFRKSIADRLKQQNLGKPKLSPKLRKELTEEYREDILKLQDLIGRDLSKWLEG